LTTARTGSSTPSSGGRRAGSESASCWAAAVGDGGQEWRRVELGFWRIYRAWEGGPMDGPVGWWVGGTRKHRFGLGLPLIIGSPMLSIVYI